MQRRASWLGLGLAIVSGVIWPLSAARAGGCSINAAELRVTMAGDRLTVPVSINGQQTRLWLDSGAFFSFMSKERAKELALPLRPVAIGFEVNGIGGSSDVQLATVKSFGILNHTINNMDFFVGGSDPGNGLIGQNILGLADTEFDLANGSVKLIVPQGCEKSNMAYWATGKPYFTVPLLPSPNPLHHAFMIPVAINGVYVHAIMDTGAPYSNIPLSLAESAGIKVHGPDAIPTVMGGIGRHYIKGWSVAVAKVKIGDEQILNTRMDVLDDEGQERRGTPTMLLGEDFIMAHHIYVARQQGIVYFTYSGGRPFNTAPPAALDYGPDALATQPLAQKPLAPHALAPGLRQVDAVAGTAGDPNSAEAFARRGAARLSADEASQALGDLDEAIRRSPQDAGYYAERARIRSKLGTKDLALADLDKSLVLDPGNRDVLLLRAEERLAAKDEKGAYADARAANASMAPGSLHSLDIASLFVRVHQPAQAIPLLDEVIAAHHDDASYDSLLYTRCRARALAGIEYDKALNDCNHLMHNHAAVVLESRGIIYSRQGNFTAAIADYDVALKRDSKMVWSLYMRGQAKIALGQSESGKADEAAARVIQSDIADDIAGYGINIGPAAKS